MELKSLFKPERTAVIGVSLNNPLHPANVIYSKNFKEYTTEVHAVNPAADRNAASFNGITARIYRQIGDITGDIDLAVIAVKAGRVPSILKECGEHGVKGAVVISGGFAEIGNRELQQQLVEVANKYDLPFIGPNCLGIYSPPYIDTIFLSNARIVKPERGNIAFISQSGGFMVDQGMGKLAGEEIGVSGCVSLGNKAFVDEANLIEYFESDESTSAMIFHIEGFSPGRGRKFVEQAEKSRKPVVVFKAGRSEIARKAVSSHTASLSGNYVVTSSIFKQYGVIEARDEFDIIALAKVFSHNLKSIARGDIAILTVSGGHGVIAVDFCQEYDLNLVQLSEAEKQILREKLNPAIRPIASLENPIDLTGSSSDTDYETALNFLLEKKEVEAVLLLMLPYQESISFEIGSKLAKVAKRYDKPVIVYVPWNRRYLHLVNDFEKAGIPVGHTVEEAVKMMRGLKRRNKK